MSWTIVPLTACATHYEQDFGNTCEPASLYQGMDWLYSIAADLVMCLHFGYVTFVVLGFVLILLGIARSWKWARNPWIRYAHLTAILIVVAEAWAGMTCPLTVWEKDLRQLAGETVYEGGFMTNLVHSIMFQAWPPWVFTMLYTVFGSSVLLTFVLAPPRKVARDNPSAIV